MTARAAVMTGKGAAAIATIVLHGDSAEATLRKVFRPTTAESAPFETGSILLGEIIDAGEPVDQVTIGCEGPNCFAIHCHGNPLIVEIIMDLLARHGVRPVADRQMHRELVAARSDVNAIGTEAKTLLVDAKTMGAVRLLSEQISSGLSALARRWLTSLDTISLRQVADEVESVLTGSEPARYILSGCTVVLIGPANSGKSTLLNTLSGRAKAIVTDVKGTTRDYVTAEITIGPVAATVIDTAGLDAPNPSDTVAVDAQQRTLEMISKGDILLLVLDANQPWSGSLDERVAQLPSKPTVPVLNKSDLPPRLDVTDLPGALPRGIVSCSARTGCGIEAVISAVLDAIGLSDFDLRSAVAFTDRQQKLLRKLQNASSVDHARDLISQLLHGPLSV